MTADELRAKFEAWYRGLMQNPIATAYSNPLDLPAMGDTKGAMLMAYQAAHASRNAEVEALRRDAERYQTVRESYGEFVRYAGGGTHWLLEGTQLDQAIDAAMREGE